MRRWMILLASLLVATSGRPLAAQSAGELIDRGVAAYHALEFDSSVQLLREGLDAAAADTVPDSTRARAHVFLGAIAVLRQRRHTAEAEFRNALEIDPRTRADPLTFPPEITNVFASVRRNTPVLRADAPADTTIVPGSESYAVRVFASTMQRITVDVEHQDGRSVRRLYEGAIGDSIDVRWNGFDENHAPLAGDLVLHVAAESPGGGTRDVRVPLDVQLIREDTLVAPPPPREAVRYVPPSPGPSAWQRLAAGVLTGVGVALVLPAVTDSDGSTARYAIGGTFAVAGVIGFFADLSGREGTAIATTDPVARSVWNREVEEVRRENERRRRNVKLHIRTATISHDQEIP